VFKHLERLEDVRDKLGARWVWELLQNARDVASPEGVDVEIVASDDELFFRHNGRSFTEDELAHLIYHGSTKVTEQDRDLIHFGSGFLSTHLLSRHVTVRGQLVRHEESQRFSFALDRSGDSVEGLNDSMQRTWKQFLTSLGVSSASPLEQGTSFSYALEGAGRELAVAGLAQLKSFVALTLAFSPEIRSVSVRTPTDSWEVQRQEEVETNGIVFQHFDVESQGDTRSHFVALAGDETVQAALPLRSVDGNFSIDLSPETPRLFVVFPLLTTHRLALPTVVQSKDFAPHEDRDGVPLEGGTDRSIKNRQLIERSARFARLLIERAAEDGWQGADSLLRFQCDSLPDWAPQEWIRTQLRALLEHLRRQPLLVTSAGTRIAPRDALIPVATTDETRAELWELTAERTDAGSRLPAHEVAEVWADNLSSWQPLFRDPTDLPEALDVRDIAAYAADCGSVAYLSKNLEHGDSMDWLGRLLQLVTVEGSSDLFDSLAILPSEAGNLHKRSELELDGGIDYILKAVSEDLGVCLRDRLLAPGVAVGPLVDMFATMSESDALDDVLGRYAVLEREGTLPAEHLGTSAVLFRWLVDSIEHRDRLEGFQVSSADAVEGGFSLITLERHTEHPPLAPSSVWNEGARRYEGLYSKRRVLHPALIGDGDGPDWKWLGQSGFVTLDPMVRRERRLSAFVSSSEIVESHEDEDAHRSIEAIELSDIAFLEEQDVGLIDTARRSSTRALELMRLVLFYAAVADDSAFDEVLQECECGESHLAFRAGWLIPLRRRKWIPSRDGNRRSHNVNAETLAELVRDTPDIVEALATDLGDKVLRAWGISPSDFQLRVVAEDEATRKALVLAVGDLARVSGSVERLQSLTQEIAGHPELITQIESQREQRQKVERNARIGELVESLLQEALSAEGFRVTRTGIGSDFELESDFVDHEQEVLIEVSKSDKSTLIEVKSTRRNYVRLTPRQAETATRNVDRFCLCVVELMDDDPTAGTVRAGSRFVFDIGSRLTSPWTDYARYKDATSDVRRPRGEIDVEIDEGQVRFRVEHDVWADALKFPDVVERFRDR
jgi:hypothetical protein